MLVRSPQSAGRAPTDRIKFQMELFNLHIQQVTRPHARAAPRPILSGMSIVVPQGRDLCSKLASVASVIKTPPAQLQSQLAIEVVSPILANSQNPLPVSRDAQM